MHGRHPSAQVLQYNDLCCLIDCGEGTQERLKPAGIRPFRINMVLISHLHGDHVFGLPGLISSYTHLKRKDKLTIYGPSGIKGLLESIISYTEMKISYPLEIIEQTPHTLTSLFATPQFEILTFPLYHRIACNGYLFRELLPKVRMNKERLVEYPLTPAQIQAVKSGEDIEHEGQQISGSSFLEEANGPVSYAYCSDTRYDQRLLPSIKGVSVLYHETTFMNDKALLAKETGHSTSGEAGQMAMEAGVSCLMTGHYSSRYIDIDPLIAEVTEFYPHVIQAEEGKTYDLRKLSIARDV